MVWYGRVVVVKRSWGPTTHPPIPHHTPPHHTDPYNPRTCRRTRVDLSRSPPKGAARGLQRNGKGYGCHARHTARQVSRRGRGRGGHGWGRVRARGCNPGRAGRHLSGSGSVDFTHVCAFSSSVADATGEALGQCWQLFVVGERRKPYFPLASPTHREVILLPLWHAPALCIRHFHTSRAGHRLSPSLVYRRRESTVREYMHANEGACGGGKARTKGDIEWHNRV